MLRLKTPIFPVDLRHHPAIPEFLHRIFGTHAFFDHVSLSILVGPHRSLTVNPYRRFSSKVSSHNGESQIPEKQYHELGLFPGDKFWRAGQQGMFKCISELIDVYLEERQEVLGRDGVERDPLR